MSAAMVGVATVGGSGLQAKGPSNLKTVNPLNLLGKQFGVPGGGNVAPTGFLCGRRLEQRPQIVLDWSKAFPLLLVVKISVEQNETLFCVCTTFLCGWVLESNKKQGLRKEEPKR